MHSTEHESYKDCRADRGANVRKQKPFDQLMRNSRMSHPKSWRFLEVDFDLTGRPSTGRSKLTSKDVIHDSIIDVGLTGRPVEATETLSSTTTLASTQIVASYTSQPIFNASRSTRSRHHISITELTEHISIESSASAAATGIIFGHDKIDIPATLPALNETSSHNTLSPQPFIYKHAHHEHYT